MRPRAQQAVLRHDARRLGGLGALRAAQHELQQAQRAAQQPLVARRPRLARVEQRVAQLLQLPVSPATRSHLAQLARRPLPRRQRQQRAREPRGDLRPAQRGGRQAQVGEESALRALERRGAKRVCRAEAREAGQQRLEEGDARHGEGGERGGVLPRLGEQLATRKSQKRTLCRNGQKSHSSRKSVETREIGESEESVGGVVGVDGVEIGETVETVDVVDVLLAVETEDGLVAEGIGETVETGEPGVTEEFAPLNSVEFVETVETVETWLSPTKRSATMRRMRCELSRSCWMRGAAARQPSAAARQSRTSFA